MVAGKFGLDKFLGDSIYMIRYRHRPQGKGAILGFVQNLVDRFAFGPFRLTHQQKWHIVGRRLILTDQLKQIFKRRLIIFVLQFKQRPEDRSRSS